jgi:hypothetical protein
MPPKGDSARDELPSVGLESVGGVGEGESGEAFCERKEKKWRFTAIHSNHACFEIFKKAPCSVYVFREEIGC